MSKSSGILAWSANLVLLAMATAPCALAQSQMTGFVFGQDTQQPLTQQPPEMANVPEHIWHAASAAVGKIKATKSGVEIAADGTALYVLDFQNEKGRRVSVDISTSGKIIAIEFALTIEELPRQVAATIKRWAPTLKASEIEKSVRPDAVVYELVGEDPDGYEFYAEIPEDGRGIVIVPNQATMVGPGAGRK